MSMKEIRDDGALVPVTQQLPSQLFEQFDRADEDQIVAELMGGVVEEYAYQFKQGGATVTGLSLAGVMNVAQNMGGITCDGPPRWEITDDEYYCEIAAVDHHRGLKLWGNAAQARRYANGSVDTFARQKALSKAQRNAVRKVIPETIATKMLEAFIGGRKPGQARPAARPQREQEPPPLRSAVAVMHDELNDTEYIAPPRPAPPVGQDVQPPAGAAGVNYASPAQIKRAMAKAREAALSDDDVRVVIAEMTGKASITAMTVREASDLIKWIEAQIPQEQPALANV